MSLILKCPCCSEDCKIEESELPVSSRDDADYECHHCAQEMKIGWAKCIEVRSVTVELGELLDVESDT